MLQDFINQLKESAEHRDILSHYHYLPEKPVEYAVGDAGLSPVVLAALERLGIPRLYSHQGEALSAIRAGKHLLVATPTASGKTLIYNLPVLEGLLAESPGPRPVSVSLEGPGAGPVESPPGVGRGPALPYPDRGHL